MSNLDPCLYVVATPIGNLEDMGARAARVLARADLIVAEDTRHSRPMLRHFGIHTRVEALHEHNERQKVPELLEFLRAGRSVALVSDAGTPLVSDPGFRLVRAAHAAGVRVVPVPGPCAAVAALSAAGLPSDRFAFEGFPPPKTAARRRWLEALSDEPRTLIFYEVPHRVVASLSDMRSAFGADREAVIARELTKRFETIRHGTLGELYGWIETDRGQQRGEFVILVHGAAAEVAVATDAQAEHMLRVLLRHLPVRGAAEVAAELSGRSRRELYQLALTLRER